MNLSELFAEQNVMLDVEPCAKDEFLVRVLRDLDSKKLINRVDDALRDVVEREKVMSTGIGNGVAIPHAYTDGVDRLVAGFIRTREPLDFDALDGEPVDLFFLILGPKASRRNHIKILAKISRLLNHREFREQLRSADGVEAVLDTFRRFGDR